MAEGADNNGGRRTNRMIYDRQERLFEMYHGTDKKVGVIEANVTNNRADIDALEKKSNKFDTITGAGVLITAILAGLGLTDK